MASPLHQVLQEIFLRIPIKCLTVCRCVCRDWNALISHTTFIRYYESHSSYTALLIPSSDPSTHLSYNLVEISADGDCVRSTIRTKLPGLPSWGMPLLTDSSDSFIRVESIREDGIGARHALTGKSVTIPTPRRTSDSILFSRYKFLFCSRTNKYKVLRLSYKKPRVVHPRGYMIFTVGVDSRWRRLAKNFPRSRNFDTGVTVHGVFHWIQGRDIVTFDIEKERFGQISYPRDKIDLRDVDLAAMNNRLCLTDMFTSNRSSLWIMQKYGVERSWTENVVYIDWFSRSGYVLHSLVKFYEPVQILRDGSILFKDSSNNILISCNIAQRKCHTVYVGEDGSSVENMISFAPRFLLLGHNFDQVL